MMRIRSAVVLLAVVVLCCTAAGSASAQVGTAFTYQGKLTNAAGVPVDGNTNFRFSLWDAASGGTQIGSAVQLNAVTVTGGLFTVSLDFGSTPFTGAARWLQIEVSSSPILVGTYALLGPRVQIMPVPYALYAAKTGNTNADTVDGFHASYSPTGNCLLALDMNGKIPNSALAMGAGNGLNVDLLDGQHGSFYQNASNLNTGSLPDLRLSGTYSQALTLSNAFNVFYGNGSGLTGLSAANLIGTIADSALSTNVALLSTSQTFTGAKTFSNASNSFTGSGAGLTALNASNLSAGTVPDARLSGTYSQALTLSSALNSFTGNGAGLTNLNAANLTGSIADARLSANVAMLGGTQTFTGAKTFSSTSNSFTGNGAGLTSLNASNLSTGTVADARLTSNVALLNRAQTFSGSQTFSTDVRSPVFYDSNNTGYYVDPAGTTNLNNLTVAGTLNASIDVTRLTVDYLWSQDSASSSAVIYGENTYTGDGDAIGIKGRATARDGYGIGVQGVGRNTGVDGYAYTSTTGSTYGIKGGASTAAGGTAYAVYGFATGSGTNYGVYGTSVGGDNCWAGYFYGKVHVNGAFTSLGKQFKIDHPLDPENKTLTHFCVEGPEMMNVYSGNIVTGSDGYATVRLPDYFEAANKDFRYQLTVVDDSDDFVMAKVVDEIKDNRFTIRTSRPSVKVSWQVTGVRNDKWAQGNADPVEQMKPASEKGKYLSPEAFGKPREMGIGYMRDEEARAAR